MLLTLFARLYLLLQYFVVGWLARYFIVSFGIGGSNDNDDYVNGGNEDDNGGGGGGGNLYFFFSFSLDYNEKISL